MSFLLKVRCHLLDGNLCVLAGLLLWVPPLVAGLLQCDCPPSQALSFPGPCSCLASVPMLLRWVLGSAQGRGHGHVAANGLGKEECSFWHREPSCLFSPHPSSPGWSWASLPLTSCPFPSPFYLGSPTAFHEHWKCKNPSDFWSEPFVIFKGKTTHGSSIQEDFGVSLLVMSVTARLGVGLNTQIHQ